ncbi:GGDEF domain-containing protein [Sandaracinobacter neustonicus]|uniref:diguanylate cyclase n=1 Tax=Sandaracinobacter neustonicus TaxID=1715348 RepID=A0A501XHJ9_9SPHN|nr:GGDEF domain-containing protein [Sandaracinobacter neustonicus]TPE60111.1 GGDEF domain-containing protein [Sandaracinobacter neustonicus]
MEQTGGLSALREADDPADMRGQGHPALMHFDAVRRLFVETGLPPDPETYELFWLHATGADPALSRALNTRRAAGMLDAGVVKELRRQHLGDIAAAEVQALLESAQASAAALAGGLDRGRSDLKAYDEALSAEDEAMAVTRDVRQLGAMVQTLRRANALMMAANRRMEADIATAALETSRLLERLDSAERAARTDPLTGLPNRRGLLDAMKKAVKAARDGGTPLAVALADIDHFKRINDQWGHAIGDEVLRCVASHLQTQSRRAAGDGALAGRHGGEEFLMLLPGLSTPEAAAAVDAARAALARQVLRKADDGQVLGRVTFSAGVAQLRADDSADSLIDRADAALYGAKRAGRDRVMPEKPAARA